MHEQMVNLSRDRKKNENAKSENCNIRDEEFLWPVNQIGQKQRKRNL